MIQLLSALDEDGFYIARDKESNVGLVPSNFIKGKITKIITDIFIF